MKKIYRLIFAVCSLSVIASCDKENIDNGGNDTPEKNIAKETLTITCSNAATKTQLAEGQSGKVIWSEGDQLKLFTAGEAYTGIETAKFDLEIVAEDASQATFSGEIAEGTTSFTAVYPYAETDTFDGINLNVTIPATQTATASSFCKGAALAWAKGTRNVGDSEVSGLQMQNVCSVIGFTLPDNITFANKVVISANNGAKIAGAALVNTTDGSVSCNGEASVTLQGEFEGGKTYYAAIAPGTYTGGFKFVVSTDGGNTYVRENKSIVEAVAGKIYRLGTLSLALDESNIACSVTIAHNVEGGILKGSTASASVSVAAEFQSIVTINSVDIILKQGEEKLRSLYATGAVAGQAMTAEEGKPYLPQGEYNYEAVVNYSVGSLNREVTVNGKANSPAPASITFGATLTGYTSYSIYTGADGQAKSTTDANTKDGSTIYGIGASYASGLSTEVYEQCSKLLSVASTLDGTAKSGDAASQSWAAHTIGAKVIFDGVDFTASNTKTVHVTGLPHKAQSKNDFNVWSLVNTSWNNSGYLKIHDGLQTSDSKATLSLYTPSDDINVTIHSKYAAGFATVATNFEIYVSNVRILEFKGKGGLANTKGNEGESDNNGTLTASAPTIYCYNTYNAGSSHCRLYNISIQYR